MVAGGVGHCHGCNPTLLIAVLSQLNLLKLRPPQIPPTVGYCVDSEEHSHDVRPWLAELVLEPTGLMATKTSGNAPCSRGPGGKRERR